MVLLQGLYTQKVRSPARMMWVMGHSGSRTSWRKEIRAPRDQKFTSWGNVREHPQTEVASQKMRGEAAELAGAG
jgi:hypothetical protein